MRPPASAYSTKATGRREPIRKGEIGDPSPFGPNQ
jgi:hypothetical protein